MTDYLLVPGAGGEGWYWHLVVDELRRRGHGAIAVDLPGDDDSAGLDRYVEIVLDAADRTSDPVVVAQSLGAFTAAMVTARLPVRAVALVNAMIPSPGETPGEWWAATGAADAREAARGANDPSQDFTHDLPDPVLEELVAHARDQSAAPFSSPCVFDGWPAGRTHALVGADDRFFPPAFQRELCRDRIGIEPVVVPGGHAIALSRPDGVVDWLLQIR